MLAERQSKTGTSRVLFRLPSCKPLTKNGLYYSEVSNMKISEDKQSLVETFFPKFCSYEFIASNKLKNPDSESSHILTNKRKG